MRPVLLLAVWVMASAVQPASGADTLRAVLLGEKRPVLVEMSLLIDGKPYAAAWQRDVDRLFADLDRDGDGVLSKAEAARAPSLVFLNSFLPGGLPLDQAANTAPFELLDIINPDGKVSRQEFTRYYQGCWLRWPTVVVGPDRDQAAALTDVLLTLLDRNRDGQLSKEELKGAAAVLGRIDLNEDEWITPEELLLHRRPAKKAPGRATPDTIGFLTLGSKGLAPERRDIVLARYAKEGRFDAGALGNLLSSPPALEPVVRLGTVDPKEATTDLLRPAQAETARTREGGLQVTVEGLALDLAAEKGAGGRVRGLHAFYRQQFEAADADRRGFLERKQVEDVASLAALFPLADRDGDGRLSDKEFDTFLDLHALGAISFVTLTLTDQSLSLFDLLDEDGDSRLSLRELHLAWERLRRFDRDGDGRLAREEFPRRLQLRCSQGTPPSRPAGVVKTGGEPRPPRGPAWFRKMDKNGDGFVSRREFLGLEETFNRLDVDGDGLLSPEEAERLQAPPRPDR